MHYGRVIKAQNHWHEVGYLQDATCAIPTFSSYYYYYYYYYYIAKGVPKLIQLRM